MKRLDPREAEPLIESFISRGFTTHYAGGRETPSAIVLSFAWEYFVDIAHIRGADRTEVARMENVKNESIFAPSRVNWSYYGSVVVSLSALERLPPPGHPASPTPFYSTPPGGLKVTSNELQKVGVRFPTATAVGGRNGRGDAYRLKAQTVNHQRNDGSSFQR